MSITERTILSWLHFPANRADFIDDGNLINEITVEIFFFLISTLKNCLISVFNYILILVFIQNYCSDTRVQ